jgi:hypothetical protein
MANRNTIGGSARNMPLIPNNKKKTKPVPIPPASRKRGSLISKPMNARGR